MMFVFGKRAKQLRLNKVSELIHNSTDFRNLEHARVEVHFHEIIDHSMHIIGTDIYFDVEFHAWTSGGDGGGFAYIKTQVPGPALPEGYFRKPDFADPSLAENQGELQLILKFRTDRNTKILLITSLNS